MTVKTSEFLRFISSDEGSEEVICNDTVTSCISRIVSILTQLKDLRPS